MNNALGVVSSIDATKSRVAAIDGSDTDGVSAIHQVSPFRAAREGHLAHPRMDARQLDLFASKGA